MIPRRQSYILVHTHRSTAAVPPYLKIISTCKLCKCLSVGLAWLRKNYGDRSERGGGGGWRTALGMQMTAALPVSGGGWVKGGGGRKICATYVVCRARSERKIK